MTHTRFPDPPAAVRSAASREAAEQVRTNAPARRQRVWEFVAAHGPCTREQIAAGVELPLQSVLPLVWQLVRSSNLRVVDNAGVTITGSHAERLMVTGREYSEAPIVQDQQPLLPGIDGRKAISAPAVNPSAPVASSPIGSVNTHIAAIDAANAAERARVAADQQTVAQQRDEFRRLEELYGKALDALPAEQLADLVHRLPAEQQQALAHRPKSPIVRFELLKLFAAVHPTKPEIT